METVVEMSPLERAVQSVEDTGLLEGDEARDVARAVLQAIRTPSEGMAKAGYIVSEQMAWLDDSAVQNEMSRIYTAMIDHAISE